MRSLFSFSLCLSLYVSISLSLALFALRRPNTRRTREIDMDMWHPDVYSRQDVHSPGWLPYEETSARKCDGKPSCYELRSPFFWFNASHTPSLARSLSLFLARSRILSLALGYAVSRSFGSARPRSCFGISPNPMFALSLLSSFLLISLSLSLSLSLSRSLSLFLPPFLRLPSVHPPFLPRPVPPSHCQAVLPLTFPFPSLKTATTTMKRRQRRRAPPIGRCGVMVHDVIIVKLRMRVA